MSGNTYLNNTSYFKPNYFEALKYIVPQYIDNDEVREFGEIIDLKDQIINSHINLASSISSVLNISSIVGSIYSGLNTLEGIAPYFIKQNELTFIDPELFELKILDRVGVDFRDFTTSASFKKFLDETLLPSIQLNKPTSYFVKADTASSMHEYLINNLSWVYFLNTSGITFNPSAAVSDLLTNKLYYGNSIELVDCIKVLSEHLFKNNVSSFIPPAFRPALGEFTSGTQQLDKLKTWIDVIYSPLFADRSDFTVKNRFELFIESKSRIENKVSNGPFSKLLRAMSFAAFDINNDTELLSTLYSIDDCPSEYLPFIANLIGWRLFGSNPERWRLQLRNAVEVYKKVGTKKSIQFAINSVFPKDLFSIESRITELWESYIPYLLMYSLATESEYFKDNTTWTRDLANSMNVSGYSFSSNVENIKLATDRIIYETYLEFSSAFNIPNKDNLFYYRGRQYPIPPFEEYPYYVNVEIDIDMIDFLTDRLACFGVRKEFALQFREYLISNTLSVDEEIRSNSWLFFTSGYNDPPNLSSIVININSYNFDFVSLWSGKSSHFKLLFDASEFDFSKREVTEDSGDALVIASQIINEFAPAHSIPLINLQLSSSDFTKFESFLLPILSLSEIELLEKNKSLSNLITSGLNIDSYKRGINTKGNKWKRINYDSLRDPLVLGASSLGNIPRSTLRKRSYQNLLPKFGYFDRTGFNMPVSFDPSASLSGIPLGFIPSSLSFQRITDYNNIPEVYSVCYGSKSNQSIYGYDVSNTLKARGHVPITVGDYFEDRGTLPEIYQVMHFIGEQRKYYKAVLEVSAPLSDLYWKNVYGSYANQATEASGWFPNSVEDYYNFDFGYDLHKFYQAYTTHYERHRLSDDVHYLDGANIFSHTFGPYLYNHNFNISNPAFTTSSLDFPNFTLAAGRTVFSTSGALFGTVVASADNSMYVGTYEFVNSSLITGYDLIHSSGAAVGNQFGIFRIDNPADPYIKESYMYGKTFLAMRSVNGFSRIRHTISPLSPVLDTRSLPSKNFLLPDSNYKLALNAIVSRADGLRLGEANVSVWIHTKPELGRMWSYDKFGNWVQHPQLVSKSDVYSLYSHELQTTPRDRQRESINNSDLSRRLKCIEFGNESSVSLNPLLTFTESDFEILELSFNTNNRSILFDRDYGLARGQVHRKSQEYVIEVFIGSNLSRPDTLLILDSISMRNETLNKMSKPVAVEGSCPEYRVDLTKSQLQAILRFWNDICGKNRLAGIASRDSNITSGIMYSRGGSRSDYRTLPAWHTPIYFGAGAQNLIIEGISITV